MDTRITLDHWHEHHGGSVPDSVDHLWAASVFVALLTPLVVWLLAGADRRAVRLVSYATAASAASWLLAISYSGWFYNGNI